jgi:hypothetical protein
MSDSTVVLDLFLRWLNEAHERHFRVVEAADGGARAEDAQNRLAIEVRPLLGAAEDSRWLAAKASLEEQLGDALPGAYTLWVPFGAVLPTEEPALSEFVDAVRQAAVRLGPHERSHVALPVRMVLRKVSDEGGVVSVTGGLNQHWARFTDLVRGTYDLDSMRVHRLPEGEGHLEELIERVVEVSKQLSAGQRAEIETVDAWTVQRLGDGENERRETKYVGAQGVTIIGVPPEHADDPGLAVRRNFRRILTEAGPRLRADAELRALVLLGHYPRMEQEGATTAMRGYDPALYSGIDFVALVADGLVKPIIEAQDRLRVGT